MATAVSRSNRNADLTTDTEWEVWIAPPLGDGWGKEEITVFRPVSMSEADGGEYSTLTLSLELGADPVDPTNYPQKHADKIKPIAPGSRVRLVGIDPPTLTQGVVRATWFVGYVGQENILIQGSPQAEAYNLTVYGPEWLADGGVVVGRAMVTSEEERDVFHRFGINQPQLFTDQGKCIFNEGGRPNMSRYTSAWNPFGITTESCRGNIHFFVPSDRKIMNNGEVLEESQYWTAFDAIQHIVALWGGVPGPISTKTDWLAIFKTLDGLIIKETDVDGLPIMQAIRAILGPLGYGFRLDVTPDNEGKHALYVYALHAPKKGKTPYLPPIGTKSTSANGGRGEVNRVEVLSDSHNIRNAVAVIGGQEKIQFNFTFQKSVTDRWLHPMWSESSHEIPLTGGRFAIAQLATNSDFHENYHTTGKNFFTNRNVFRTFILNEDYGGLDYSWYKADGLPDMTQLETSPTNSKRPFGALLVRDAASNAYLKPIVKFGAVSDSVYYEVDVSGDFEILKDRAGVRLKKDFYTAHKKGRAEAWLPFENVDEAPEELRGLSYLGLLADALTGSDTYQFLITVHATIGASHPFADEDAVKSTTSPLHLTRERVVRVPTLQKNTLKGTALGGEDTRNDINRLIAMGNVIESADDNAAGNASLMLNLTAAYPPGTVIPQTSGRVVNLAIDSQRTQYAPVVRRCTHHFGETNMTEVLLDSPLLRLT